jgi:hypothetical protein
MSHPETLDPDSLLATIPQPLRNELLEAFNLIVTNFREERWEPSELNGGKLCEVVYTILRGYIDGAFPTTPTKPGNMVDACRAFEQASSAFPRSVRIQIPRMLIALYEVRNNRGVCHVGSDVNANQMDATCVLYVSKWIVAELVRLFHNVDTEAAEAAIDSIVERTLPVVWKVGERLRILDTKTTMKEKTLLLLYQSSTCLREQDLFDWVEHSNASTYRRDVLRSLHHEKLIEYEEDTRLVYLSPKGVAQVEKVILSKAKTVA